MRGRSGAARRYDGTYRVGDVTPADDRTYNLAQLLMDLSHPGLCIVLGAGSSYGVVPRTRAELKRAARELRQANGTVERLDTRARELFEDPYVLFVAQLLGAQSSTGDWDALVEDHWPSISRWDRFSLRNNPYPSRGEASVLLQELFTPREIPPELRNIYHTFNSQNGFVVTYNYDRLVDETSGFTIIAPHGQRAKLIEDPKAWEQAKRAAYNFNITIPPDIHLPIPENNAVANRPDFDLMIQAWRAASCVVLIGYGFGSGADAISYHEFGSAIRPGTRVHVIAPAPDNTDLVKQIEYALRGRHRYERVTGHPFRWRPLAASILKVLENTPQRRWPNRVRFASQYASEIVSIHDRW